MTEQFEIRNPLLLTFRAGPENTNVTHIYPPEGWDHKHYGLLICDVVRHVANALKCNEDQLWEWIDKERYKPTTDVRPVQ